MEVELVRISPSRLYICLKQCHAEPNHLSALRWTIRHSPACKRQHSLYRPAGWPGSRWASRWPSGTCACNRQHASAKPEANLCYSVPSETNLQQQQQKTEKEKKEEDYKASGSTGLTQQAVCFAALLPLCFYFFLSPLRSAVFFHFILQSAQVRQIWTACTDISLYVFLGLKQAMCHPTPWKIVCVFYILINQTHMKASSLDWKGVAKMLFRDRAAPERSRERREIRTQTVTRLWPWWKMPLQQDQNSSMTSLKT